MHRSSQAPFVIRAVQYLYYISAALWAVFGIVNIIQFGLSSQLMWMIIALMVGNAAALLFSGLWLRYQSKWGYLFAAAILALNIILTITDQFGVFDLITLVLYLVLAGLLIGAWRWYWSSPVAEGKFKKGK